MSHGHSHAHEDRRSLLVVLAISIGVLVLQVVGGMASGSLALLADAGHVFTDVVGVLLALGAIWLGQRPATDARTFGWYRAEILAAALNAVLLLAVSGWVLVEGLRRLQEPPQILSGVMLAVALAGAAGNIVCLAVLRGPQRRSLNLRGAYLEVLGDLAGSVAVVVAAVLVLLTGWVAADALASILIGLLILPRTWHLLREAVDVLMEATPRGMDLDRVRQHILDAEGVTEVHDLHAWLITSGLPVVSAHVVIAEDAVPADVLDELCRCLSADFDVEHSTFQLETQGRRRIEETSHA